MGKFDLAAGLREKPGNSYLKKGLPGFLQSKILFWDGVIPQHARQAHVERVHPTDDEGGYIASN